MAPMAARCVDGHAIAGLPARVQGRLHVVAEAEPTLAARARRMVCAVAFEEEEKEEVFDG
jgi:hypothetical protein